MRARGAQLAARLLRCASTSQPCSHGLPQTGCLAQALALGSPTAAPDARLIASRTSGTCLGSSSPLVTGQWQDHACSCAQQQRCGITADARPGSSEQLTNQEYHRLSDLTLADLMSKLEPILEDCGIEEAEIEYSEGVMTLSLGEHGTYVINKQAPNKQLWLSSPVSGPARYDCKAGSWISGRDDSDLHETLEAELSQVLGSLELEPAPTVRQGWLGYGADPT